MNFSSFEFFKRNEINFVRRFITGLTKKTELATTISSATRVLKLREIILNENTNLI